ncbi:MAG TPA: methyltransferase domain-containing protein, partial [Candidatus Xenobia bacterium]
MGWDPAQYERFAMERRQPFDDLLAQVERRPGMRVVDLGCGTGELTVELHQQLGAAATIGIDSSASMLTRAPQAAGVRFEELDIAQVSGTWDLVFSNAALHWLPDHRVL